MLPHGSHMLLTIPLEFFQCLYHYRTKYVVSERAPLQRTKTKKTMDDFDEPMFEFPINWEALLKNNCFCGKKMSLVWCPFQPFELGNCFNLGTGLLKFWWSCNWVVAGGLKEKLILIPSFDVHWLSSFFLALNFWKMDCVLEFMYQNKNQSPFLPFSCIKFLIYVGNLMLKSIYIYISIVLVLWYVC